MAKKTYRTPHHMPIEDSLKQFSAAVDEIGHASAAASGAVALGEDDTGHRVLLYTTKNGVEVQLRFDGESFWATQKQMSEMFGVKRPAITKHLANIFAEGELVEGSHSSILELTAADGKSYQTKAYDLNALIAVGYRVGSKQGTMFRIWATDKLFQILTKGFYVDKERLKENGSPDALDEFREIAREIRTSIRNSYREVLRLCALCSDYDGTSASAREFFMGMENKLLWAAAGKTAPQLILERADAEKNDMGLTYFAGRRGPTKDDVTIGNNYLAQGESQTKGRITEMWLTYVEDQLEQGRLPTMAAVTEKLDGFIKFNQWPLLKGAGKFKRDDANAHAWSQLETYRERVKSMSEAGSTKVGKSL